MFWHWGPEIGASSIDWAQLSNFHLKMETESSLQNTVCLNKNRAKDMSRNTIILLEGLLK
jgi:hypothetical protein